MVDELLKMIENHVKREILDFLKRSEIKLLDRTFFFVGHYNAV
jgi:hypothetical protein